MRIQSADPVDEGGLDTELRARILQSSDESAYSRYCFQSIARLQSCSVRRLIGGSISLCAHLGPLLRKSASS